MASNKEEFLLKLIFSKEKNAETSKILTLVKIYDFTVYKSTWVGCVCNMYYHKQKQYIHATLFSLCY